VVRQAFPRHALVPLLTIVPKGSRQLSTKVAIVTGSSRGIGRAIARRLAADGFHVVVNCRVGSDAGATVVDEILHAGDRAVLGQCDITEPGAIAELFGLAEVTFGGVDVFVHNAPARVRGDLIDETDEDFDHAFGANARSTFVGFREGARRIRDGGRLVFISSGVTRGGSGLAGQGLYTASKTAGEALARAFARELGGRGITVNSVLPGVTRTQSISGRSEEMLAHIVASTPLGRIGEPEDVADAVGFLCSERARWITGQSIAVDGGITV